MTKDKSPAFPTPERSGADATDGMTLRDFFANSAMQAFIHEVFANNIADHGCESVAKKAYYMADAMLKARNE
jgi:hypothetical protein